jgi:NAD+ diphosphatase
VEATIQYFVVANDNLLCAVDGRLLLLDEFQFVGLNLQIISRHTVTQAQGLQIDVVAVEEQELRGYQWLGLRSQIDVIDEDQFQRAGRALQILRWHFEHQYCGRCGRPTFQHARDLAKTCSHCALDFFPRLSPCIITLVTRGDYCLLARHRRSVRATNSCLAGFIEVGESPEQALVREVKEEVSVSVGNIRYFTSQPWPFPGQLMLGYFADYISGDIVVDQDEILEAHWYSYDNLPSIPSISSISGRLIDAFVQSRKALHSNLE